MTLKHFKNSAILRTLALTVTLLMCQPSLAAYETARNAPSGMDMTADLLLGRPALLVATVAGAAVWLVALPFSALGGNVTESADTLVIGPAKATFLRCLGCSRGRGYQDSLESVK